MTYIIIEHLEETYSLWLILEYINASKLVGRENMIYSNIRKGRVRRILGRYGKVYSKRIKSYIPEEKLIILDPRAEKELTPEETSKYRGIVIGGILGDNPPRGRTSSLLSREYRNSLKRNLGRKQLSIDGAVYTAFRISSGDSLKDIDFYSEIRISTNFSTLILPYKYPLIRGKPIFSPIINQILKIEGIYDEYWTREL